MKIDIDILIRRIDGTIQKFERSIDVINEDINEIKIDLNSKDKTQYEVGESDYRFILAGPAPTFDINKPLQTRNGRKVRILTVDRKHNLYPIVGMVENADGEEWVHSWRLDGKFDSSVLGSEKDLVNVEKDVFAYVNVQESTTGQLFPSYAGSSRTDADIAARHSNTRVGCNKVKLEKRFDD